MRRVIEDHLRNTKEGFTELPQDVALGMAHDFHVHEAFSTPRYREEKIERGTGLICVLFCC